MRDVNLLKIILCSGLYPNVAIADDCNSFKGNSEQAYHTKVSKENKNGYNFVSKYLYDYIF